MALAARGALFLTTAVLRGALAFLLGLLGGQPDGDAVWIWLCGSFAITATLVFWQVRLILGARGMAQDVEWLALAALLGGLLLAGFAAAFIAGIYVSFEQEWGDRGIQGDLGGIDQTWQSWLSEFLPTSVAYSSVAGAFLGSLAWASRFVRIGAR